MVENKKLENETNEEKVPETVQNEFMLQLEDESKLAELKNSIIEKYYGDSFNTELWKFGQSLSVEQLNDLAKGELQVYGREGVYPQLTQEQALLYKDFREAQKLKAQRAPEPQFDYDTGVKNKLLRFNLANADTPNEKELVLNSVVGEGNWGVDRAGKYYLKQEGLINIGDEIPLEEGKVGRIIDEKSPFSKQDFIEMAAYAPQFLAAMGAGMRFSGYGFVPGVIASGAGEVAGYLTSEMIEYLQGYQNQPLLFAEGDDQSMLGSSLWNFAYGAGGEGFVRFLRPLGRMITDPQSGILAFRANAPLTKKKAEALINGNREEILSAFPDLETKLKSVYKNVSPEEYQKILDASIAAMKMKVLGINIYKEPARVGGLSEKTGYQSVVRGSDGEIIPNPDATTGTRIPTEKQITVQDITTGDPSKGIPPGVPSITQGAERPIIGRLQAVLEFIFGNKRDMMNRVFLDKSMLALRAEAAGMSEKEIFDYISRNLLPKDSPLYLSDAAFGKIIAGKLGSEKVFLSDAIEHSSREINGQLNLTLKELDNLTTFNKDKADEVLEAMAGYKTKYNVRSGALFKAIDDKAGVGIFDGSALKTAATEIEAMLPTKQVTKTITESIGPGAGTRTREVVETVVDDTLVPPVIVKLLRGLKDMDVNMTGTNLQGVETFITSVLNDPALLKGIGFENIMKLNNTLDGVYSSGIAKAAHLAQGGKGEIIDNLTQVLEMRNNVGKKIAKVNGKLLTKLAQSNETVDLVDAGSVFTSLVKTNDVKQLKNLLNVMPVEKAALLKTNLNKTVLGDIIQGSKGVSGDVNVTKLLSKWENIPSRMKTELFSIDELQKINSLMFQVKGMSGTLDNAVLEDIIQKGGGEWAEALQTHVTKKLELDNFMKANWKNVLSNPDTVQFEQAIDAIFQPQSSNLTSQVLKHFEGSPEIINAIKTKAMEKILRASIDASDNFNIIYSGANLNKTLDKFGVTNLKTMFGKELTDDLFSFARSLNLISQGKGNKGGLVAANLALAPLRKGVGAVPELLTLGIISRALASKNVLKYLALGLSGKTGKNIKNVTENFVRAKAAITASGALEETAATDPKGPREFIEEGGAMELKDDIMTIPERLPEDIPYVPFVENRSGSIPEGSRMVKNMAPPLAVDRPDTMNRGKELFTGPGEITFAAKGGIMNTRKAFQRVA